MQSVQKGFIWSLALTLTHLGTFSRLFSAVSGPIFHFFNIVV